MGAAAPRPVASGPGPKAGDGHVRPLQDARGEGARNEGSFGNQIRTCLPSAPLNLCKPYLFAQHSLKNKQHEPIRRDLKRQSGNKGIERKTGERGVLRGKKPLPEREAK